MNASVLRLCPNLVDCTFHDSALPDAFIPKEVPIVHQRLRTLTLGLCSPSDNLIDYITLPALSSLSLQSRWQETWELGLVAFLLRSGTLTTFKVHTDAVSTDQLIELLHHLPKLTELYLKGSFAHPLGDVLFESLTYDETAEDGIFLCPELRAITLAGYIKPSEGTLAKMLRSRCHSESSRPRIARLQKVTVMTSEYNQQVEHLGEVEVMRDHGINVTVRQELEWP
jgi:hypothetical protein